MIDETHDPARRSWIESANGHESFPIQNLPFGIFSSADGRHRAGIAIGDAILDLGSLADSRLLGERASTAAAAARGPVLNDLAALPAAYRQALRQELSALLASGAPHRAEVEKYVLRSDEVRMHLPLRVGNYTDFFAGIHHARAASRILGRAPDVAPNYRHVPIAYNGRASTVAVSGAPVAWPNGQHIGPEGAPVFGASRALDYETEVAMWIAGENPHGEPVPIASAGDRLLGIGMLNDWSARDMQRWEAMPLGPFLAKTFHTTVSPWIVTVEALAPFRIAQPARDENDPAALPYLSDAADQAGGAIAMAVETTIRSRQMRDRGIPPHRLSFASLSDLYWTPAQMIAHHTSNGCDLLPGDLLGTGTISAAPPRPGGCLLEITENGATPIELPTGEQRLYLEPDDEIALEGFCRRDGFAPIGTGPAIGILGMPRA